MKILRKIKSHANKIFAYLSLFSMLANTLAPLAAVVPSYVYAEDTGASDEVSTSLEGGDKTAEGQGSVDGQTDEDEKAGVGDSDTNENKVEENGDKIENKNPGEDKDVVDPEAPDIIKGGGVSDYRPIADIEDNETVEVDEIPMLAVETNDSAPSVTIEPEAPIVGEPIVAENSAPSENIEPETPAVKVEEKRYEHLEDGAEIKDSVKEDWNVDGEVAKTINKVKLGVKYIFPLDEEVSVTFTKLPELEEDRDYLKIERVKVSDLNLPDDFKTNAEYAFDITTFNEDREEPMKNGKDFEYEMTLPKPEGEEVEVVYIEKSKDEKIKIEDIKEIEEDKLEQNEEKDSVKVKDLDHLTLFIPSGGVVLSVSGSFNGVTQVTVEPSETIKVDIKVERSYDDGYGGWETNDWESTSWRIDDGSWVCKDTNDHTGILDGTSSESFNITAPSTEGIYDVSFRAHRDGSCGDTGISNTFTLTDGIIVEKAPPVEVCNDPEDDYSLNSSVGIWTDVDGGSSVIGVDTKEVRWGTGSPQSGLRFDAVGTQTFDENTKFLLGTLTHMNWPITDAADGATLEITLSFSEPEISPNPTFTYEFKIEETPNVGSCPSWQKSNTHCDDRITFPNSYGGTVITIDDIKYTLVIDGFVDSYTCGSVGSAPASLAYFITEEQKDNTAYLVGHLSSVLIEKPAISILKKTNGIDVANSGSAPELTVGGPVNWQYIVQNTGNVDLTNVTITDYPAADIDCDPSTVGNQNSGLTLASGADMTCTASGIVKKGQFTNIATVTGTTPTGSNVSASDSSWYTGVLPPTGSIKIIKDADPNNSQDFNFTSSLGDFYLDDDSDLTLSNTKEFSNITSGTYTVTEQNVSGWGLTSVVCTDTDSTGNVSNRNAVIQLDPGETVTCTFTNTRDTGTIELKKFWLGTPGRTNLNIGTIAGGTEVATVQTGVSGGTPLTTGQQTVPTGTYYLSESGELDGYTKSPLSCFNDTDNDGLKDENESMVSVDLNNDSVSVAKGNHIICRYTNTYVPYCGDGVINQTSEQCDGSDGVAEDGSNFCTPTCKLVPIYDGGNSCPSGTVESQISSTTISPTNPNGETISLTGGKTYLFEAVGEYGYGGVPENNDIHRADAGYATKENASSAWASLDPRFGIGANAIYRGVTSLLSDWGTGIIGLVNWGNYNSNNHAYKKLYSASSNVNVKFVISDWYSDWYNGGVNNNQGGMGDNEGSLTLNVYECKPASEVTICKKDNKNRPQQGWEVALASEKVDGPTPIDVSNGSGTNSTNLPAGKYLIKVSGTYRYGNSSMDADAGFSFRPTGIPSGCNCWLSGFDTTSKGLMAWVNGSPVNWGARNSGHTYTYVYTHSSNGPVNISIWDDYYEDNVNDNNFQFEIYEIPGEYYGTTEDGGCVTLKNIPYGNYILDEVLKDGWVNLSGKGSSVSVGSSKESFTLVNKLNAPVTIVATKIVCDNESDLPDWGAGGPNITANTAQEFLSDHTNCHAESGWYFQWGDDGDNNPGDTYVGEVAGWNTFGPTGADGKATTTISDFGNTSQIKVREVLKDNYIPFTYLTNGSTNKDDVSAEIYCDTDVLNYDNDDRFTPEYGKTYYCVAWNTLKRSDIYGFKWNDLNGNGKRDCDSTGLAPEAAGSTDQENCNLEPLLSGWKVFIDKNGDGIWQESEDFRITSASGPNMGKYVFEQLPAGQTYKICEVPQEGWTQTYPTEDGACHSVTVPGDCSGDKCEFNFGNYKKPALSISKTNDASGPKKVGDTVKFTIKITAHDNFVSNVHVYDLFSKGFEYVDNSWIAISNTNPDLAVGEPTYASPADWNLGSMVDGETITLTYEARVTEDIDPGIYNDIAWTDGEDYYGKILGYAEEGEGSGKLAENFVGTQVEVEKETPLKTDVDVKEEEKEKEGDVLGASTTIELPATGASTIWVKFISAIAFVGVLLLFIGGLKKMLNRRKNIAKNGKNVLMHLILIGSLAFVTTKAYAASTIVRLSEPKSPATSTFDLVFVAMDTEDRDMQAECEVKKPVSSSFSAFGPVISIPSGKSGDSEICPVDASVLDSEGTYTFKVKVTPESESSVDSNEVTVEYDSEGPDKPKYIEKEKVNDCVNKIKVKTADDGETASVKVYADDDKEVDIDDSHRIETESMGPNETFEFEHIVSGDDCDKDWYYAVVAFDDAGNASNPRAETVTTYTEGETKTEEETAEETGAIPVEGGAGLTGEAGTAEGEAGEGQEEEKTEETSEEGSVLGEQIEEVSGSKSVFKSPWFWVGLVGLGIIIFSVSKKSKKAQR